MSQPDETPKLPKWVFVGGDLALVGAAWAVARYSAHPLSAFATVAVVGCVALGVILGAIPFIVDYAEGQEAALKERQDALEALTRTAAATAEQISIAAGGLHEIASSADKRLREADQAAYSLLERLAELQGLLADARDSGKEETARLESAVDRIAHVAAEGSKADLAARAGLAKAVEAAEARAAAAAGRAESAGADLVNRLEPSLSALQSAATALRESATGIEERVAALEKVTERAAHPPSPRVRVRPEGVPVPIPAQMPMPSPVAAAPQASVAEASGPADLTPAAPAEDPAPAAEPAVTPPPPADRPASPPTHRRRAAAAVEPAAQAAFELGGDKAESTAVVDQEPQGESSVAADGATRLLVTAYIGIGNRLFIRGDGPGLSWSKGVPLQFVSIGKWRWETADAASGVRFKLYKNDQAECLALGERTVEAGHQLELRAGF